MPTNYALRSPVYAQATSTSSLVKSVKMLLTINGTLAYTIVKDAATAAPAVFEISELVRDYLNITFSETFAAPLP